MNPILHVPGPVEEPMPVWPLPPDGIISGTPDSRGKVFVESTDGKTGCGQWRCSPGKFRCSYDCDEFFWIIDGEVELSIEGGPTLTLRSGDTTLVPCGTVVVWHVLQPVHKVFFFRRS